MPEFQISSERLLYPECVFEMWVELPFIFSSVYAALLKSLAWGATNARL
jgi:hypothetical protein